MAVFILIHGSWQGPWCWQDVLPRLENKGHRVVALELPGHGNDTTPLENITLDCYVNATIRAVDLLDESPILAAHSMGFISQVAEIIPDRIRALAYIAGLMA